MSKQNIAPQVGFTVETPEGTGEVTEVKAGWIKVQLEEGIKNFRAKDITVPTEEVTLDQADQVEDEDDEEVGVRIKADLETYEAVKAASGNRSYDRGDKVAMLLRGKTLQDAYKIANRFLKDHGQKSTVQGLMDKYEGLNPGHQRMCLGNKMRAAEALAAEADEE